MGPNAATITNQIHFLHPNTLRSHPVKENVFLKSIVSKNYECFSSGFNGNISSFKMSSYSNCKTSTSNPEAFQTYSAIKSKPKSKEANESSTSGTKKPASGFASKSPSGFGSKSNSNAGENTVALLKRSQNLYVKILKKYQGEGLAREFIVCVRHKSDANADKKSTSGSQKVNDWLPVSEMILVSEVESHLAFQSALPFVCREITECASSIVKKLQYYELEYCFEHVDSFYDHVVKGITNPDGEVHEECPYSVLGIQKNATPKTVRTKYRELAALHHPDKHIDGDQELAQTKFKKITGAYERIKRSGNASEGDFGGSYETLGGSARVGLSEPCHVSKDIIADKSPLGIEIAVRPLDIELVQLFMLKNASNQK